MLQALKKANACAETRAEPIHSMPFGTRDARVNFKTCIGNFTAPWVLPWLRAEQAFQRGVMPFPGALLDQPAKVIDLFDAIQFTNAERERKAAEALKRKTAMTRGARRGR